MSPVATVIGNSGARAKMGTFASFDGPAELPRASVINPLLAFNTTTFFNGYTPRVEHTPTTAAQLQTLLTGGTLNGQTLQRGDWITLTAGTNYNSGVNTQSFPVLSGSVSWTNPATWVWVRTSALSSLPVAGRRVSSTDNSFMPLFRQQAGGGVPPLDVLTGARGYVFTGIAGDAGSVTTTSRVFQLGSNIETVAANNASHIVIDRCHVTTVRSNNSTRTIIANCGAAIIRDSYLYNTAAAGVEDQAIASWNGAGPHLIDNNYLVAGGENIMYGGADPASIGLNPQDIVVRRNYFFKPLTWNRFYPSVWDGVNIVCKNLFELKKGIRVLVEDNVLENYWKDDQAFAVNLKSVNQAGGDTTAECRDVVLRYNKVVNVGAFCTNNPAPGAPPGTVVPASRLVYHDNVVTGIGASTLGASGSVFVMATSSSLFRNNTCISDAAGLSSGLTQSSDWTTPTQNTIIHSNIVHRHSLGMKQASVVEGTSSIIAAHGTADAFPNNTLVGPSGSTYPSSTQRPAAYADVGFVDFANGDYRLASNSPVKGTGLAGVDPGADVTAVNTKTAGCLTGAW